jgi:hypothetical protein
MKKIIGLLLIAILTLTAIPALGAIYEDTTGNTTTYFTNPIQNEWRVEYEDLFYEGLGHKQYEVLYQNGYRTTTTRYTGAYIVLQGEVVNNTNYVENINNNKGEWRFISNVERPYFINQVTSEILYVTNINPNSTPTDQYDPYGEYNPYSPDPVNCLNNNSSNIYLNIKNTPVQRENGYDSYYLQTGNKKVTMNIVVPYGYAAVVGAVAINNKTKGVYDYYLPGTYNLEVTNGFAVIVPRANLVEEFNRRLDIAIANNWAHKNVLRPR